APKKKPAKKKAAPKKKPAKKKAAPKRKAAGKKPAKKKATPKKKAAKKKPAKKKIAPRKKVTSLGALQDEMDKGFRIVRNRESTLARQIEEVRQAGERILDQVELLQAEAGPLERSPLTDRFKKLDSAIVTLQEEMRELSKETQLCNAGPVVQRLPEFETAVNTLREEMGVFKEVVRSFTGKINELSAKFNMHSHFLKAKNWNQDLLFHTESPAEDKEQALPESPRALGVMPARLIKPPAGAVVDLRLTPPRHWDDPVIWFDNVAPVEEEEEKES
ncbi:MAG: hypothetical protein ACYTHN_05805, partial [Planctomycetota bacterium]